MTTEKLSVRMRRDAKYVSGLIYYVPMVESLEGDHGKLETERNGLYESIEYLHKEIDILKKKISDANELIPYFEGMGDSLEMEMGGRDFNYDENVSRLKKALK